MSTPDEVRTCAKCGQTAVVQVFQWSHTTFGAATGETTRELRCQSCGAWFVLRARSSRIALWAVGVILTLTTCIGGLPFLVVAWMRGGVEKSIPVVPGAPMPAMRFRGGPPFRTCGKCGGVAVSIRVTRSTHNGLPTGTEYEYRCQKCEQTFVVESPWGMMFAGFSTAVVFAIAAAFLFGAESPWWKWGGASVTSILALFLVWQTAERLLNRFRHPVMDDAQVGLGV